jgi:hypothetical protein
MVKDEGRVDQKLEKLRNFKSSEQKVLGYETGL